MVVCCCGGKSASMMVESKPEPVDDDVSLMVMLKRSYKRAGASGPDGNTDADDACASVDVAARFLYREESEREETTVLEKESEATEMVKR